MIVELKYEDIQVNMKVVDDSNNIGVIKSVFDIHNIEIEYDNGGVGIVCLDKECNMYEKIYRYE